MYSALFVTLCCVWRLTGRGRGVCKTTAAWEPHPRSGGAHGGCGAWRGGGLLRGGHGGLPEQAGLIEEDPRHVLY
jgi:hypothetical protein